VKRDFVTRICTVLIGIAASRNESWEPVLDLLAPVA
jgi:hypothetical protein